MAVADRDNRVIRLLASIPRGRLNAQGHPEEEHRVALCEYNGNPYISIRLFWLAEDGNYYPSKKGDSIRLGEAEEVAAAILEGLRIARESEARPTPAERPQARQRPAPITPTSRKPSAPREVQTNALDDLAEYRR